MLLTQQISKEYSCCKETALSKQIFPCIPFYILGITISMKFLKRIVTAAIFAKAMPLYSPLSRGSSLMSTYSSLICGEGAVVTNYSPKVKKVNLYLEC
jgi:hypothetical protein